MSSQLGAINSVNTLISKAFQQPKGDLADRLNSRVTVLILALSSVFLLSGHFMGDPINCWTPAQFTKQWIDFVNQYCYVHGTYFVPLDTELEFDEQERRKIEVNYYQWVPYVFALQALMFYIPRFFWKVMLAYSGYDLGGAIRYVDAFWNSTKNDDASFKARVAKFEGRPSTYIWDGLRLARKKSSRDLPLYYCAFCVIQALNAWSQWVFLNSFLQSPRYSYWGPSLIGDLVGGEDWQKTGHFPRITHCDFNRRRPASVQLDTVLCVLGLNIYYEKLCVFLWFWFLFVAIVSSINCFAWMLRMCRPVRARQMLDDYLSSQPTTSKLARDKFFRALGKDGMFVLQHMTLNLGALPASYLTIAMRNQAETLISEEDDDSEELQSLNAKAIKSV